MHLYRQVSSAKSGQHKKQELRVRRLQAEHRETYLFLGSSTQKPRAGENRAGQHEWRGEKSKEETQRRKPQQTLRRAGGGKKK